MLPISLYLNKLPVNHVHERDYWNDGHPTQPSQIELWRHEHLEAMYNKETLHEIAARDILRSGDVSSWSTQLIQPEVCLYDTPFHCVLTLETGKELRDTKSL